MFHKWMFHAKSCLYQGFHGQNVKTTSPGRAMVQAVSPAATSEAQHVNTPPSSTERKAGHLPAWRGITVGARGRTMAETQKKPQQYNPDKAALAEMFDRIRQVEAIELNRQAERALQKKLDGIAAAPHSAREARAAHIAETYGIELHRARFLVRSLNSIESLAIDIADTLEWDHEGDAADRAQELAGITDWSPEGLADKFHNIGPNYALANTYLRVRRLMDSAERGDLIYVVGELAEVARNLLAASADHRVSAIASSNASSRWTWLEDVKAEVFRRRKEDKERSAAEGHTISRAKSIEAMREDIRAFYNQKAVENGRKDAMTVDNTNAERLLERWCREAGID